VTSREDGLRISNPSLQERFEMLEVSVADEDIRLYVEGRVTSNERLEKLTRENSRSNLTDDVTKAIKEKAAGMYETP
jgi:hypothetical protein